jgi:CcmD family protein
MPDIQMAPYVLGAYAGAWLVLTGYLAFLAFKVSQLNREVEHLKETAGKR